MSRAKSVHHINIQTPKRSKEWYEKVFCADVITRGTRGQLQAHFGTWEIHFSETSNFIQAPLVHFAVEVDDWDAMLANLDQLGLAYGKTVGPGRAGTFRESRGGDDPRQGRREYDGSHYTYLQDPDGHVIALVWHS